MSIEHAFGLREAVKNTMNDPEVLDMMESFLIYLRDEGLNINEEIAESLFNYSWTLAAAGVISTSFYFLGEEGMESVNTTLDELIAIEDSMGDLLDTPPDTE